MVIYQVENIGGVIRIEALVRGHWYTVWREAGLIATTEVTETVGFTAKLNVSK